MPSVLGLHAFTHDASAALCVDGCLAAFVQEERHTRRKGDASFPRHAIDSCLHEAGIRPGEVGRVVLPFRPQVGALKRLCYLARRPASFPARAADLIRKGRRMRGVRARLRRLGIDAPVMHEDHYLAHARTVFCGSPFDQAAILIMDGVAEGWSGALYHAFRHPRPSFRCLGKIPFPHSLGLLYAAVTEHLGLQHNREEGKVMAMAALGDGRYADAAGQWVKNRLHGLMVNQKGFDFAGTWTTPAFHRVFGSPRKPGKPFEPAHFALARAVQEITEAVCVRLARDLMCATACRDLCFGGGLALNPALNGVLARNSGCKNLFVVPAGGDAGTALGGALGEHANPSWQLEHAFWGVGYPPSEVRTALEQAGLAVKMEGKAAIHQAAGILDRGGIGGWFQGRSEMGPRALGHRSMLADPRRVEVRERINSRIKGRESFQPLAPAVLIERCRGIFPGVDSSPFMLQTFPLPKGTRERIPAVVHADGTSRIQTVTDGDATGLSGILGAFGELTGLPVLLNTSLNRKGEPMAESPSDAVRIFLEADLDFLFLDGFLAVREGQT
jgi:carbamoyltransferase